MAASTCEIAVLLNGVAVPGLVLKRTNDTTVNDEVTLSGSHHLRLKKGDVLTFVMNPTTQKKYSVPADGCRVTVKQVPLS